MKTDMHNTKTKADAIADYRELTFKLAKVVDQLAYIKERMSYINTQMNWDGMFELDFDNALVNLAKVESAAILYTLEDEFRDSEIRNYESEIDALKCAE